MCNTQPLYLYSRPGFRSAPWGFKSFRVNTWFERSHLVKTSLDVYERICTFLTSIYWYDFYVHFTDWGWKWLYLRTSIGQIHTQLWLAGKIECQPIRANVMGCHVCNVLCWPSKLCTTQPRPHPHWESMLLLVWFGIFLVMYYVLKQKISLYVRCNWIHYTVGLVDIEKSLFWILYYFIGNIDTSLDLFSELGLKAQKIADFCKGKSFHVNLYLVEMFYLNAIEQLFLFVEQ